MLAKRCLRNTGLTAHITFSVGWFGAVASFLALSITGLVSNDIQVAEGSYIAMELISWFIIVPACLASLLTGIWQSLITKWGLFRYYWVAAKLLLTVVATIVLLVHMRPIDLLGNAALGGTINDERFRGLRVQLIADAGAALLVLLTNITLSVYKPWGRLSYTSKSQSSQFKIAPHRIKNKWFKYLLLSLIALVILLFILLHFTGALKVH